MIALSLVFEQREVEADIVTDDDPLTNEGAKPVGKIGEGGGAGDIVVGQAVDRRGGDGDRDARIDQTVEVSVSTTATAKPTSGEKLRGVSLAITGSSDPGPVSRWS